ncbi:MAG: ABC transporter permease [Bdellovibrionaceae bacterium]|nr:ABC transporter permease [Pseudobdellovibrionaceae bacterium]
MQQLAIHMGGKVLDLLRQLGGEWILLQQVVKELSRRPLYGRLIVDQIYQIGIRSSSLVLITAASTGMVMALQFGLGLEKFGGKLYVPKIVSLSIVREIGPVFCSLMLAARVGAGIASEIGSMVVTQQIDAIRALGTSPIKKIVIPRIIGCVIALPLLTAMGDLVGVTGGLLVGKHELNLDPSFYLEKIFSTITITDYMAGIGKTFFFALFIGLTSCYFGLNVSGGTKGVGQATTKAVVASSIMILVSDYFLTKLFFLFFEV